MVELVRARARELGRDARDHWEVGPWIAVGFEHSTLTGPEMMTLTQRRGFLTRAARGAAARYRFGEWFVGGQLAVEGLLTNTTYTKLDSPAQVFEIPRIGAVLSVIVGVDFAPG